MVSRRRRILPWLAAMVVAVFLVTVAIILMIPASFRGHLPNPNGYGDFVRASEVVQGNVGDYPTLEHGGLEA